jgi:hypothetical protein
MSRKNALDEALDQPGYPRMAPHEFYLPNAKEWFGICGLLAKRRIAEVETFESVCKEISLDQDAAKRILDLISAGATTKIRKHYVNAAGGLVPPLPVRDDVWLDAIAVGRAISESAKRDTSKVRHVLSVFAMAANLDRQIVLTVGNEAHIHFAKILKVFVQELKIHDLGIGLVAFKNGKDMHANLRDLCEQLGLEPENTSMRTEKARNSGADSPARQAGIEVLRVARASAVTDQAFFSAMILGAAVQVWRFAPPSAATPATETSVRPVSSRVKPIDATLKLPPASASPGTDQDALRESLQRGDPG